MTVRWTMAVCVFQYRRFTIFSDGIHFNQKNIIYYRQTSVGSLIRYIFVIVIVSLTELTDHFRYRYRFPSISVIVTVIVNGIDLLPLTGHFRYR